MPFSEKGDQIVTIDLNLFHGCDEIRLAFPDEKRLLVTAAAYERPKMANFVMGNVLPTVHHIVDCVERIALSERDAVRVLELLENPPKPTPALMDAARRRTMREVTLMDSRKKPIGQ